ncbi:hypothetical protein LXL04_007857 [Taraxacum kok-saghyz]
MQSIAGFRVIHETQKAKGKIAVTIANFKEGWKLIGIRLDYNSPVCLFRSIPIGLLTNIIIRMAARRPSALLLTDSNVLLSVISNYTFLVISKVMKKNPIYVLSDTLAVEALQKMVQGLYLPFVENGKVIALLDIAKCLYDAIARMERAAEKGKAIEAVVEGVEKHWGSTLPGPNSFIETLTERMFKPALSTIISDNTLSTKNIFID